MKSLRLAIDIASLSRDHRGMGFFLREFLRHLPSYLDSNTEIRLINHNSGFPDKTLAFPGITAENLDASWLVWFPFNYPGFEPPGNYVVTIHDLAPFIFPPKDKKLQNKYIAGAKKAQAVIVDSRFIANETEKILKIEKSKIQVIPPGFDAIWDSGDTRPRPFPYLLAIGPAEPRKNLTPLFHAFQKIKKKFPHKLVIIGELPPWRKTFGPLVIEVKNPLPPLARRLGLQDEIIFTGVIPRPEVARWYRNASAVIIPSLYEGFGFPVLEAYSWGLPVVCSRAASLPELAGEGAFFIDPDNSDEMAAVIEQALSDKKTVEYKKSLAKSQLSQFSWKDCILQYLKAFQNFVSA